MLASLISLVKHQYTLKAIGFILLTILGLFLHFAKETPTNVIIKTKSTETNHTPSQQFITIHISGAIKNPGVYTLSSNTRLHDALETAGKHLATADLSTLNLAQQLKDGQKIQIPYIKQKRQIHQKKVHATSSKRLSINTSSIKELDTLPGIGPSLAKRIVKYRETHGRFQSLNDLTKVSGIGPTQLRKLKHLIYL